MSGKPLRVLLVEDVEDDALLVLRALGKGGYEPTWRRVDDMESMVNALESGWWDVVISDYSMPHFDAPSALRVLQERGLDIPLIIVSGTVSEETAVTAMKAGAADYITKGNLLRLVPAVDRELREAIGRKQHRRAEEARRRAEQSFRALVESSSDWTIVHRHGIVGYVNPAAVRGLGYESAAVIVGRPFADLVHPDDRAAMSARLARLLADSDQRKWHEERWLRADGGEVIVEANAQPTVFDGVEAIASTGRDVTDRKRIQEQLMISDRMASIGTLAAGLAHEINSPLAAILVNLDLALRDIEAVKARSELPHDLLEELQDARDAATRVQAIVRDVKVFSGRHDGKMESLDLHAVLDSTLRIAANELRHHARVVKDYGEVPRVRGSEARLGQALLNIIVNAAQAIPEGHAGENQIRVRTRSDGARVRVEISDTGVGMSAEVRRRLFTPFFTTKPVGVGTGLGLSIAHRIVTELGGTIDVESTPGKGTTFALNLRKYDEEASAPGVVARAAPEQVRKRGRLLVVDDDPLVRRTLQRTLGGVHDVTAAASARDALAYIDAGERYDAILCDLMMPDITGMDLHARLAEKVPEQAQKMIFLTGGAFTPRARSFLDEVAHPRLEKPFSPDEVLGLIEKVI